MILSIITINYNNAEGLRKTLVSVASQTYAEIEHIIIDGGSTDNSIEVIREYESSLASRLSPLASRLKWLSEKDTGIYNAMNKGIEIALGRRIVNEDHTSAPLASSPHRLIALDHYIQILNSGDILAAPDVTERMMAALAERNEKIHNQQSKQLDNQQLKQSTSDIVNIVENKIVGVVENKVSKDKSVEILYGNMIKVNSQRQVVGKSGYTEYSLRQFYSSTLNHDCAYIRKDLFDEYGLYDEKLKIVSDWKWYLQAIGLGRVKPEYVDIDVTIFDDGGISETNLALRNKERRQVLEELLPPAVLWDYDTHAFEMEQMKRLRRWRLYPVVYFMERVCFKFEKWGIVGERLKVRG